jgi:thioredoxin 1
MIEHLNVESFKQKVFDYTKSKDWKFAGDKPAIIDFYADWCGPCKVVSPILEELAEEYSGKMDFYKIDTEDQKELASIFGIQSIPSLLFIPSDEQPQMAVGALSRETFVKAFKEVLHVE